MVARTSARHECALEPSTIFRRLQFYETGENHQAIRRTVLLNALRSCLLRGTGRAYSVVMLKKRENMNPENDAGPVVLVPAVNFKTEVIEAALPVLVEFWTSWSRPCQILDSVLQELAHELAGKVKVVRVDADDSIDLSLWYDIQSIPTLIYFVAGKHCFQIVGTASKEAILAKLKDFGVADQPGADSGAETATSKGGLK